MYKIYLVDDEQWGLDELQFLLKDSKEFTVCGAQTSPLQAEQEIEQLQPQILISDIFMTERNGLELVRRVKETNRLMKICFLSAYDRFDYAKQAILLGASDYIVKPVRQEEFFAMLRRMRDDIVEDFANFVLRIGLTESGDHERLKKFEDQALRYGVLEPTEGYRVAVCKWRAKEKGNLPTGDCAPLLIYEDRRMAIAIVPEGDIASFTSDMRADNGVTVGISRTFIGAGGLFRGLKEADFAAAQPFVTGRPGIYAYRYAGPAIIEILERLRAADSKTKFLETVDALEGLIDSGEIFPDALQSVVHQCTDCMLRLGIEVDHDDLREVPIASVYRSANEWIAEIRNSFYEEKGIRLGNKIVDEVLEDIRQRYPEKLTLSDYSKKYFFNASYLSQLFKKHTRKSFVEYLVEYRMERAKEWMLTSDWSMSEIAYRVGYDDYFHFSKLFKKYNGVTPTDYRQNLRCGRKTGRGEI